MKRRGVPILGVIIPSYNHAPVLESSLPTLIRYLNGLSISYEIIICDDGSSDGGATGRVARALGCAYVRNARNQGKGGAVKKGMLASRALVRIYTDADIPFEFEAFKTFLHYLSFKEFDVVTGDRTLPESSYFTEVPLLRRLGSLVYSNIVGRLVTGGIYDTQCGMKGFRAEAAEDIFSVTRLSGFAFDVEVLYLALKRNYDIKRLPVVLRNQGPSSVNVLRDGGRMLLDLGLMYLHFHLGHYRPHRPGRRRLLRVAEAPAPGRSKRNQRA